MLDDEYREYLRRADRARTVRDLRAVADEARRLHPNDPEAALIGDACAMYAAGVLERYGAEREVRSALAAVAPAAREMRR